MNNYNADFAREATSISDENVEFWARFRRTFGVALAAGVVLAVISPLRTDLIGFFPRLAYWEIIMLSGASLSIGATETMLRWGRLRSQPWIEVPATTLLISLPLTFIVIAASRSFYGTEGAGFGRFLAFYGMTFTICLAVHSSVFLAGRTRINPSITADLGDTPLATAPSEMGNEHRSSIFSRRLPSAYQQLAILALQAEDHFLRVHFESGQNVLIRARLSDAVHERPEQDGARTHRSWWVSRAAITKVTKVQGRTSLTLRNGLEVPVSRSSYRDLSAMDWFASLENGATDPGS